MTDTDSQSHLSVFPFEIVANILRYSSTRDLLVIGQANSWYRTIASFTLRERIRMSESADRQLIHVNAFANDEIANTSTNSDSSCEMHMRGVFSSIDSFSLRISYSTQSVIDGYAGPKDSPEPVVMEVPCNKTTNLEFSTSYAMMKPNWKQIENFVDTDTGHVSCSTLLDQVHGSNSQDTRIVLDGGMIIHCQVRNQSQSTALTETNQTPISIEFTTIEVPVGWWLNNKESFTNANQQMCGSEFIFW